MASLSLIFDILARDKASGTFREVGNAADDTGSKTGKFGAAAKAGLAVAAGAVAAFGVKSIQSGADFDATMRQVAAVTGEPKAGLQALSDLALKFGEDTTFSAGEAGDAMLELAKGGLTTAQIRAGALDSTLTLAAAGGVALGDAATFVSNGLNTFGLNAKSAGAVAAALSGGANASSASVESLGQALAQVGPGAVNAGLSIQETVAALAAFDNAGIKGSDAGTSLKTMLTRLVPTTEAAASEMGKLGLKFTDSKGAFLPLRDVAQQLQDKLKGLTEEQRTTALATIFGSDATRAASVLAKEGAAGIDKLTKATSDQEAAQRQAKVGTEGVKGALDALGGSVETVFIRVGLALGPAAESVIRFATELVNGLIPAFKSVVAAFKDSKKFVEENSTAFTIAAGIIATIFIPHLVSLGVTAVATRIKVVAGWVAQQAAAIRAAAVHSAQILFMLGRYVALGVAAAASAVRVVAGWAVKGAAAVAAGVVMTAQVALMLARYVALGVAAAASAVRVVAGWVLQGAAAVAAGVRMAAQVVFMVARFAFLGVQSLLHAAKVAAAWLIAMGPIAILVAAVIGLAVVIIKNWDKIKAAVKAGVDKVVDFMKALPGRIMTALGNFGDLLLDAGGDLLKGLAKGITGAVGAVVDAAKKAARAAVDGIKGALGINSPSRVFATIGAQAGAGLIVGLEGSQSGVASAARALAGTASVSASVGTTVGDGSGVALGGDSVLSELRALRGSVDAIPRQLQLAARAGY